MESKYYTPKIEEFCVGFEFEHAATSDDKNAFGEATMFCLRRHLNHTGYKEYNIDSWYKKNVDLKDMLHRNLEDINDYIIHGWLRVKCLDKEDIESFGFKFDATRSKVDGNFVGGYGNEKYYLDYSPYNYNGSFDPNVHLRIMKIKDFPITNYQNDYQFIYDGIIKNKSELKKLLVQLEVINE